MTEVEEVEEVKEVEVAVAAESEAVGRRRTSRGGGSGPKHSRDPRGF